MQKAPYGKQARSWTQARPASVGSASVVAAPIAVVAVFVFAAILSLSATPRTAEGANCTDSDGGIAPGTFGTVFTGSGNFSDFCIGNATLTEYYCNGNQSAANQTKTCPRWMNNSNSTCVMGACT